MYSVSESYKNALLQKHITDMVEGTAVLKDGTVIELDDSTIVNGSLKITHELCDDFKVGTFNLGSMRIGFFDDNALGRDFSGAKITLTYKIKTEAGWESVPLGIFIADGQTVIRRRNTVTLTAYDYGILFDCNLGVTLSNMTGTAEQIISAVCERCGVEFGGIADGLPNTDVYVHCGSQRIQSCRDLVGWCAAMIGGYAVIDRSGALKIIPARYEVEAEDPSIIIIDKYVTAAERNSIYSTDTRAWIAQMSAYSGDKTKIYKSNITRDDPHAARAIYYLEKNPLMESLDESRCDEINCAWLSFMDGFMQRGITAELYGDPALDVGDVLRCSEGDVDQRSSVVGLVTKQEWRYRNYHTVICASAQLSDGFPDNSEEGTDGAEAVGTTDSVYPVKVVSQSEKKQGTGGKEYYAGEGLGLSDNTFILRTASSSTLGGVRLVGTENISPDDPSAKFGIFKEGYDGFPALRTALSYQKGGFFLGDGFVPELAEKEQYGETYYSPNGYVHLRLGGGLEFADNDETATDPKEIRENSTGGRRVAVKVDGQTVKVNDKGELYSEGYAEGAAIVFRTAGEQKSINVKYDDETIVVDGGKLKVNIDGKSLKINDDGKLEASGAVIEKGIIIQEADAKYLLHEYTEVEYIAGNKIGYAGANNPVIMQNIPVCEFGAKTPNGVILPTITKDVDTAEQLPDVQTYTTLNFPNGLYIGNAVVTKLALEPIAFSTTATDWQFKYYCADGTTGVYETFTTDNRYPTGCFVARNAIWAPNEDYPYGYATVRYGFIYAIYNSTKYRTGINTQYLYTLPFKNEAEYNAAVGLTYEPVTLTEVTETITEV